MELTEGKIIFELPVFAFLVAIILSTIIAIYTIRFSASRPAKKGNISIIEPFNQTLITSALESSENPIIITDLSGNIFFANQSFSDLTGYTLPEILGKNPRELIRSGRHSKDFYNNMWNTILSGKSWSGEFINRRKDGRIYHEETSISPVHDSLGQVRYFIAIKKDISQRKDKEIFLQKSEQKFRSIFTNHSAIMMLIDPNSGLIIDANQAAVNFYGYSGDELKTMYIHQINQLDPELLEKQRQNAKQTNKNYFIFPHRLKSGVIRIVEVHSSPIEVDGEVLLFSIVHDITERNQLEEKLRKIAVTDDLTELANRRQFFKLGNIEFARSQRTASELSVIMTDADHFKSVNDQFGHAAGDAALKMIAACFLENLRVYDIPGRIGGEEFGIILPNVEKEKAAEIAERIRISIQNTDVDYNGKTFSITMSFGIADSRTKVENFEKLLQIADEKMYQAKTNGRNQVQA